MTKKIFLSVIIPVYNEEFRIKETLIDVDKYLKTQIYKYEILVVNDGSKDGTVEVVKNLKSKIANLKLVNNKENNGKGYIIKQGMLEADGKYRLFIDADNSTPIGQVEKMWPLFNQGYDIVIGSRDMKDSVIAISQSKFRVFLGNVFNLVVQAICGLWGVWDTQCGFKCFNQEVAKDIFPRLTTKGWAFDVEILVLANKLGYKFKEMPVRWINNPKSKVKLKGMIKMLFDVFRIRLNLARGLYD